MMERHRFLSGLLSFQTHLDYEDVFTRCALCNRITVRLSELSHPIHRDPVPILGESEWCAVATQDEAMILVYSVVDSL